MAEGLEVRVLGPTQVVAGGAVLPIQRRLERALVVRLALARGSGVPDDVLARDLWGEVGDPAQRLRVQVHRLRQALGAHAVAVQRTAAGYAVDAVPADLVEVEQARRSADPTVVRKALDRWRGPSLADLREVPFAATEGARLDNVRLDLQADLAQAELGVGALPTWLDELAAKNPLHERLVGLHAVTLYRSGRQADALACLDELRGRLAEELGVDPSPETVGLHVRLLRQDPALLGPDQVAVVRRGPVFVGRTVEMSELTEALGGSAVITLVGGPGVGKTRLAREVAAAERRNRRVAWVDLAPLATRAAVIAAVATAAGVEPGPGDPLPRCREVLKNALLVMDNAEHLTEVVAEVAAQLDCSVLITSQTAVKAREEFVRQLGPLSAAAASTLFVAQSGATPGPAVDRICAALDHLPLAVELAAGLTRTLTVEQIADRVHRRLRLLVGGPKDAGRHVSLRAAIDWSHALLPEQAQVVLRRLAVFAGGWTLETAEQVLADDEIEAVDIAALLTELHDRCLVQVHDGRFRLLESVREYALERLHEANDQATKRRHADWCVELATRSQTYGGPDHPTLLDELRTEEPNLRAAIGWALGTAPETVVDIVTPTWWYWWQRGLMADGADWLRRSLAATVGAVTAERSAALRAAASLTRNGGAFAEARELGEQALEIARTVQNDTAIAAGLVGLSITNMADRNFAESLAQAEEAVEVARRTDNIRLLGATINVTGGALRNLGRTAEAERKFHEAIAVWDTVGDRRGIAGSRSSLGLVAWMHGDHDAARDWLGLALRTYRELDLVEGLLDVMELYARIEVDEQRPQAALRLLTVAAARRRTIGAPLIIPDEQDARDDAERKARETAEEEPGDHTVASLVDDLLQGRPIT